MLHCSIECLNLKGWIPSITALTSLWTPGIIRT